MAICGDVSTFGFLYSVGQVARPGDGPGGVQKAKSAKNDRNHRALPLLAIAEVSLITANVRLMRLTAAALGALISPPTHRGVRGLFVHVQGGTCGRGHTVHSM